ncbi:MAG: hypothetical protein PHY08_05110 [Candidatus Cloacimonetes bacterium]|jgi:ABC-type nitrate/sulfonate/bicarbonate transport system substrate-binding protein|nr:hypothetical protein [Candidatus Cloacimonadota bacterium]MDD4155934.1 hypothetical protein [Candidatus Cloacimonadota bacterium]
MNILRLLTIITLLSSLFLVACGGSSAPKGPKEVFSPDWYQTVTENETYVFTYGNAEKVSQNASESGAYANAMSEAALYVESHVQTMIKNFISESGEENPEVVSLTENVTKMVANTKFQGAQITQRKTYIVENGKYKTFMQVAIPKDAINKDLVDRIKKEEALYNRFRASQAFEELEKATSN